MTDVYEIAKETMEEFPIGCRVVRSDRPDKPSGTVVGYSMGGDAIYGFSAMCCIHVHWDGNKHPSSMYKAYARRVVYT